MHSPQYVLATVCTGHSMHWSQYVLDFHNMVITILTTTFPIAKPKTITYRDFSKYGIDDVSTRVDENLKANEVSDYESFEKVFWGF